MAAITNTVTSTSAVGNREDLEDVIYRVAPEETPFQANIGSTKVTATKHEWQTEALAAADADNAQYEGDDLGTTFSAGNNTTRVGNYTQIFRKDGLVSGTEEEVNKAGRDSELKRQQVIKGIELRRDMEARFMQNKASIAESAGVNPRRAGGALAWLTSNTSLGAGGSNGGYSAGVVAAATNGTQRAFTESQVKSVLAAAAVSGGKPTQAYMGATHKQQFSAFTGIASIRVEAGKSAASTMIVGGADVYGSDFGNIALIPHVYGLGGASSRDCLFIDPTKMAVGTLRGVSVTPLAKTGDAEKFMITAEKTLVVRNQAAHGAVRDLT